MRWEIPRKRLEPEVITCSAVISACEKGEQWEKALALLREIPKKRLDPEVTTYSAAISACEKRSNQCM